jgi:hypothetical protein
MTDFIKLYELDVILCDHFFEPCISAAIEAKIPFVVTTALEMTKGKLFFLERERKRKENGFL